MKKYANTHKLTYIEFQDADKFYEKLTNSIVCYDPVDHDVLNKLKKISKKDTQYSF
jgi:hypothetical protein